MSKITGAEVEAGLRELSKRMSYALGISWDLWAPRARPELTIAMRAALEAAEAVRVKAESNLQKVQIPTSTLPEGFIPWHGGECPVAEGTAGEVLLRNATKVQDDDIGSGFFWAHDEFADPTDIIGYRIHKPADFRLEAGKFYVTASGERVGPMRRNPGTYGREYQVSGEWGRWWWSNGKINFLGSREPDLLALSSNQENNHD
jgi:hypothetical protein